MQTKTILHQIVSKSLLINSLIFLVLLAFSCFYIEAYLYEKFDENLLDKTKLLVTLVEYDDEDGLEFDFADEFMPEFGLADNPMYFHLWLENGQSFERSNSLKGNDLSVIKQENYGHLVYTLSTTIIGGTALRVIQMRFKPQISTESRSKLTRPSPELPDMFFVVAKEIESLNAEILRVDIIIAFFILLILFSLSLVSYLATKSGLKDLSRVVARLKTLNAKDMGQRISNTASSLEVNTLSSQINDLLERIERSYIRERQFSDDVAHELKTPIAELRAIAEIQLNWPDKKELKIKAKDALAISENMDAIVTSLLALARCESGNLYLEPIEFNLVETIKRSLDINKDKLSKHSVILNIDSAPNATVLSSKNELNLVFDNLIDNASKYSLVDTPITIFVGKKNGKIIVSISNHTDTLEEEDLNKIFDRLWQKQPSRSLRSSCGLGLSLVKAYCTQLNIGITPTLSQNVFSIELEFPSLY